jgi:hypothetical protein
VTGTLLAILELEELPVVGETASKDRSIRPDHLIQNLARWGGFILACMTACGTQREVLPFSSALNVVSSRMRCWGSKAAASVSEMEKNGASNLEISRVRKWPPRNATVPLRPASGWNMLSALYLSSGASVAVFRRSSNVCQNVSAVSHPPGSSKEKPTIAIGSGPP